MRIPAQAFVLVLFSLIFACGCTHLQLRRSTLHQATTLTELQYQQVLNNLAMFCVDPNILPSIVAIKTGTTQTADTGTGGVAPGAETNVLVQPLLTGSRTIVEQWNTVPITDDKALELLRMAFRRAIGFDEKLDVFSANDLAHDLVFQLPTTADTSFDTELLTAFVLEEDRKAEEQAKERKREVAMEALPIPAIDDWGRVRDKILSTGNPTILEATSKTDIDGPYFQPPKSTIPTSLLRQVIYEVNDTQRTLLKITPDWFGQGAKRCVPPTACFVGHFRHCYVWVDANHTQELADLTQAVLKFSSLLKDRQVVNAPSGVQFSPGYSR